MDFRPASADDGIHGIRGTGDQGLGFDQSRDRIDCCLCVKVACLRRLRGIELRCHRGGIAFAVARQFACRERERFAAAGQDLQAATVRKDGTAEIGHTGRVPAGVAAADRIRQARVAVVGDGIGLETVELQPAGIDIAGQGFLNCDFVPARGDVGHEFAIVDRHSVRRTADHADRQRAGVIIAFGRNGVRCPRL